MLIKADTHIFYSMLSKTLNKLPHTLI